MTTAVSRGNIKTYLDGRGLVTLRPSDHVATGGEGSLYRVGSDTVVKIYSEPDKMRQIGIADKVRMLSKLNSPYVVAPLGIALSEKREAIGYYMSYVEGHPLSRVFTTDFWNKEGFTEKHAQELVARMRETVMFAHSHKAVLVDANELNWLVKFAKKDPQPRVVDVDSWSVGKWPATVIMPSIRDYNAQTFAEKSDWFSWGVVTFQVFTGLHPYKGTHPSYKRHELIERMKANASVFGPHVRLNHAVRDFSLIPKPLLDWYQRTFEKGERTVPPSPFDATSVIHPHATVLRAKATGTGNLLILEKLYERPNDRIQRIFSGGAVLLSTGILVDPRTRSEIATGLEPGAEVVRTEDGWLIVERKDSSIQFSYVGDGKKIVEVLPFSLQAKGILRFGDRLFTLGDAGLTEIKLHLFGSKALVSAGLTWSVMFNSTTLYDGVGVQDAMGAMFLVLPTAEGGVNQVRVKELDGQRVVAARSGLRFVAVVVLTKSGEYKRIEFVFSKDYSAYQAQTYDQDDPTLNLAILPKGVNAMIMDEGELTITVPSSGKIQTVSDKNVTTDMILGNFGDQVVYVDKGALWTVRMK